MINQSSDYDVVKFMLDNNIDIIKTIDVLQDLMQKYINHYKHINNLSNKDNCLMIYEKLRGDKVEFSIYNGNSPFETVMIHIKDIINYLNL